MSFQQQVGFATGDPQSTFTSQMPNSQPTNDRKGSSSASIAAFGASHDWQDVRMETKHNDDRARELSIASGASMNPSSFKHEPGWSPVEVSGSFNQTGDYDNMMPEYSVHTGPSLGISFDHNGQQTHSGPSASSNTTAITSMQPQVHFDIPTQSQTWVPTTVGDAFEFSPLAPQGTRHTPVFATSTSILRRDGIRKKNARFEIPAERNLRTIDHLISQTNDEAEIKELKQQKRLLRNRQAALDSRQRKKQHTERLEEEKKQFTNLLTDLEEELGAMKLREAEWVRQRDELLQNQSRMHQWCQQLQAEKEDTLRAHTIESGQLRKENSMLLEQLQRADTVGCNTSGTAGFSTDFADFEQLTIHNNTWTNFPMQPAYGIEAPSTGGANTTVAVSDLARTHPANHKDDKTPTSGILLMLLLCGAWIISRESPEDLKMFPSIIPEDLRTASAVVIQDLYKGSGIQLPETQIDERQAEPRSSDAVRIPGLAFDTTLDDTILSDNSVSDIRSTPPLPASNDSPDTRVMHQSNACQEASKMSQILREAVRSTRATGFPISPTELSPKSMLMDRVPKNVLRDFAQMVSRKRSGSGVSMLDRSGQDAYD